MAKQKRYNGYLRKTFIHNGKRFYVYGKTAKELAENEIAKRAALAAEIEAVYNPTLNAYYDHFTAVRGQEVKESTIRSQGIQFRAIAGVKLAGKLTLGEMPIKDITRRNIEDARQLLLSQGKTPQYLNNCFAHLNHVFQSAVLDDTIAKNPCKALKQLKRETPLISENKHRALTEDETKRFFSAAAARNSYYLNGFALMIKCGLRVGELAALRRSDVDFGSGFLHIRRTIARNAAGGYIVGEDAKTKSGNRDIPLTDDIYDIIKAQDKLNRVMFGLDTNPLLFRSAEGQILREYSVNREIRRICAAADIELFTCHAFRNTFATRFIEQRPQEYKILSEILGHKDVAITLNLYTHVMTENKVKAMNSVSIKIS